MLLKHDMFHVIKLKLLFYLKPVKASLNYFELFYIKAEV